MTLSQIQIFESLFHEMNFFNWRSSAAYYVLLIENFPAKFRKIHSKGRELLKKGSSIGSLQKGKDELLAKGLIAQVILSDTESGIDREAYLPVNPLLVWEINKEKLTNVLSQEDLTYQQKKIIDLKNQYLINMKSYGIGTSTGSITILYNENWLFFTLVNDTKVGSNLYLILSGLRFFEEPFLTHFEKMLSDGSNIKAIIDEKSHQAKNRIENVMRLMEKYPKSIEVRYTSFSHVTSRRIIFEQSKLKDSGRDINIPILAIDIKKLLLTEDSGPTYIGTFYFQKNIINILKNSFDESWNKGVSFKDIPLKDIPETRNSKAIHWNESTQ